MNVSRWFWILLIVVIESAALCPEMHAALIGHWTFDSDYTDSSGNGLNGFAQGSGNTVGVTGTGRRTGVLQLTGLGNAGVNDDNLLDLGDTFTIAAWIKPTGALASGAAEHIVRKLNLNGSGGAGSEVYYLRQSGTASGANLDFLAQGNIPAVNTQLARTQSPSPAFNVWTFVAATYDGPNAVSKMFIGSTDVPVNTGAASAAAPRATTDVLRIGRGPNGGGFNGLIDDVWIFNTALTDTEVASVRDGTYVPPTLTGDYNGNGHVDAADYVMWRKDSVSFGGPTGYETWRQHFGQPAGGGVSSSLGSVPEPGAAFSVVGCCFSILRLRRRRRRGSCSRISVNSAVSSGACSR